MPAVNPCGRNHVASQSNYAQVKRLLSESRAVTEPAEAHGTLAGALCATGAYRLEDSLADILPEGAASGAAPAQLREGSDETRPALTGTPMQVNLMMPHNDKPRQR